MARGYQAMRPFNVRQMLMNDKIVRVGVCGLAYVRPMQYYVSPMTVYCTDYVLECDKYMIMNDAGSGSQIAQI